MLFQTYHENVSDIYQRNYHVILPTARSRGRAPGAEPLVEVRGGAKSPEAESFSSIFVQKSGQELRI